MKRLDKLEASVCYILNRAFQHMENVVPFYSQPKDINSPERYAKWEFERAKRDYNFFTPFILLKSRKVLDLGCGFGGKTCFYAENEGKLVGIDISKTRIRKAISFAIKKKVVERTNFLVCNANLLPFKTEIFDNIISNDTMEHLSNLLETLQECQRVLKPRGTMYITFGPPWKSPNGGHLGRCFPWTHLLFSEKAVKNTLIKLERLDQRNKNNNIYQSVNKLTIRKFLEILQKIDLRILHFRLWTRPYISPLLAIPLIKEFFTAQVITILQKK